MRLVYSLQCACMEWMCMWKWKCVHTKCWLYLIQAQFKYALTSTVDNCTPYTVYSVQRRFTETKTVPLVLQTLSSFVCSRKKREKWIIMKMWLRVTCAQNERNETFLMVDGRMSLHHSHLANPGFEKQRAIH